MSEYTLHIRSSPTGSNLITTAGRIRSLTFAYDAHGCAELTADLHVSPDIAYVVYNQPSLPHVIVCYNGAIVWAGRLEEPTVSSKGLRIVAAGYWQTLTDNPYTALWSTTKVNQFRPLTTAEVSIFGEQAFEQDTNNRVMIGLKNGVTITADVPHFGMAFEVPSQGERDIVSVSFDYVTVLPSASYKLQFLRYTSAWALSGTNSVINGSGSGSFSATFTGVPRIVIDLYYNGTGTLACQPYQYYAKITNLRIATTTGTSYGSDIATAVVSYADSINNHLDGSVITATSLDLKDEIYEDRTPASIIERLAGIDNVRAYVDEQRVFWYNQAATGRWQLDIADIEVQRPLDRVFNRAYGVYQDASNRTLRTADADNSYSQNRYGLIRSQAVEVRSTSSTQASSQRDTSLSDTALPAPRAGLTVTRVLDDTGRPTLAHLPRPGDTAVLANLPPGLSTDIDQIRTFAIGRTQVHLEVGHAPQVTIEPSEPVPTLTTMLARIAAT